MKKLYDSLEGGSVERQEKKKLTVKLIYATLILIACLVVALLITFTVTFIKNRAPESTDDDSDTDGTSISYVTESANTADLHSGSLILVNKTYEYIFADNPAVVPIPMGNRYGLKDGNLYANQTALSAFNNMMDALYSNVPDAKIVVMTAYRSPEDQTKLNNGTPAGASDFHTGMSFELKDGDTWAMINASSLNGKYDWLYKNAHKYGFIVRYPDDIAESSTGKDAGKKFSDITGVEDFANVFRYVGIAHASYIYQNNLCLEEYLELIKTSHDNTSPLSFKAGDGRNYDVYYFASAGDTTDVQVPSKYSYEISGDNKGGYIVTVNKSKIIKNNETNETK